MASAAPTHRRRQQPQEDAHAKHGHAVFREKADTDRRAECQPRPCADGLDANEYEPGAERPQRDLRAIHRQDVKDEEEVRRERYGQRRERLREQSSAEPSHDRRDNEHERNGQEDGKATHGDERVPEQAAHARHDSDHRRVVNVPHAR
jgi:hypothetical protein